MRRLGLRLQILLTLTAAVVAGLLLVHLFTTRVQTSTLREERARQAQTLAGVLVRSLEGTLDPADPPDVVAAELGTVAAAAGAEAALLLDAAGTPMLPTQRAQLEVLVDEAALAAAGGLRGLATRYVGAGDAERLLVRVPITLERFSPKPVDLLLILSTEQIRERVAVLDGLVLLFASVVLLFIVVIGHLVLTRLVVAPVRRVIRSMDRFQPPEPEGAPSATFELGPALPDPDGNEIERLATAFNRMAARLKDATTRHQVQLREARELNRRLQDAHVSLVRSEKLASVGLLTAGIAHEIGNPVSIILGYVELLQQDDSTPEERADYVAQIDTAAQRVNHIIKDLLDFSRPISRSTDVSDVCDVVRRSLKLLSPQPRFRHVRATTAFEEDRIVAAIDDGRLQQVLVNLLLNAADAMGGKGEVTLRVWREADRVLVDITDRGPGIAADHLIRIFDPFFTTKGPGAGTGLGLSICHTIITTYGGDIRVHSKVGEGTSFVLDLAVASDRALAMQ